MRRRDDWEERLQAKLAEWAAAPGEFAWGTRDCRTLCTDLIEAMTDERPSRQWDDVYASREEAEGALRERGYHGAYGAACELFGDPIPVAFAQRGDLVFAADDEEGPQFGICLGRDTVSWSADGGLAYYPTLALRRAWAVAR